MGSLLDNNNLRQHQRNVTPQRRKEGRTDRIFNRTGGFNALLEGPFLPLYVHAYIVGGSYMFGCIPFGKKVTSLLAAQ